MNDWRNSHTDPPKEGQRVYYFGENIGLWTGTYKYEERGVPGKKKNGVEVYIGLCPHAFYRDDGFGNVDACDAPYWQPYDAEREYKGWRPLPPREYLKGLFDD
jgi:hypothetical protein